MPKAPTMGPNAPPAVPHAASAPAGPSPAAPAPLSLITLERPFDVDEFAQSLGENQIRVVVPREDLPEVLRRITDFMGFGIYVYSIRVHPHPEETLKKFVVELQRVDYSPGQKAWAAFEEKGRSESPFGPDSTR